MKYEAPSDKFRKVKMIIFELSILRLYVKGPYQTFHSVISWNDY